MSTRKKGTSGIASLPARTSFMTIASYGVGKFLAEFLTGGFAALAFKFYETEMGLAPGLVALAIVLYSVWNAVNDPLIGFFTSRRTRLSARYGRRFPWIVIGTLLCPLFFFAVFSPPGIAASGTAVGADTAALMSPLSIFVWFLVAICLYDALYSTWELNYQSIFPDRFRSAPERARAASISTLIGVLGIAAGAVVPTFIIRYGDPSSYRLTGLVFCAAAMALSLLLWPGVRETPGMIARFIAQEEKRTSSPSFFSQLARALGNRNFLAFILLYFFYQSATISMTASIHYVGNYLLGGKSTTLIFAGMLSGALVSVPVWQFLLKKIDNRQVLLASAAIALGVFSLPLMVVQSYMAFTVAMAVWGLAFGGFWLVMTPALADVVDELVLESGARDDGVYLGFRAFAGRLAYAVQALSFWIAHELTGFNPAAITGQAKLGIRIHTSLVPAILVFAGAVLFFAINRMNGEKARSIRERLSRRGL